jgi:heme oxygenase
MLLKNNNFLNPTGIVFFNGYGAETGKMWTAFQNVINSISGDDATQQMLDAANDTFLKFKYWIQSTI